MSISLLIGTLADIIIVIIFVDVIISYFLPPYHNVRVTLDRIVEPMVNPIRRVVPSIQGLDFSPIILIFLIQVLERLLRYLFGSMGL